MGAALLLVGIMFMLVVIPRDSVGCCCGCPAWCTFWCVGKSRCCDDDVKGVEVATLGWFWGRALFGFRAFIPLGGRGNDAFGSYVVDAGAAGPLNPGGGGLLCSCPCPLLRSRWLRLLGKCSRHERASISACVGLYMRLSGILQNLIAHLISHAALTNAQPPPSMIPFPAGCPLHGSTSNSSVADWFRCPC